MRQDPRTHWTSVSGCLGILPGSPCLLPCSRAFFDPNDRHLWTHRNPSYRIHPAQMHFQPMQKPLQSLPRYPRIGKNPHSRSEAAQFN